MSVSLYDNAILEKFKQWVGDTGIKLIGSEETKRLFETIADEKNDKPIQLPLITLSRVPTYSINVKQAQPLAYSGSKLYADDKKVVQLNAVPITINYIINVYTRYLEQADEITRNIIFNLIKYPSLQITIPYNDINIEHKSSIHLIQEVDDNQSVPERLISGQFTRMTMGVNIDDAYLFDVRIKDTVKLTFDMKDGLIPKDDN